MIFKNLCVLVLWTKVASALEGLRGPLEIVLRFYVTIDNNFEIQKFKQNMAWHCKLNSAYKHFCYCFTWTGRCVQKGVLGNINYVQVIKFQNCSQVKSCVWQEMSAHDRLKDLLTFPMLKLYFHPKHKDAKIKKKHIIPVMLLFIGKLLLSTLRWVPMCQGFNHFQGT